jgi:ferrous iron transport protein B
MTVEIQRADRLASAFDPNDEPPCVVLAGQPNVGKSTVFNILTGLSQHVGNWPGKTIEKKVGTYHQGDIQLRVVDLPGTYSLAGTSPEEQIARDYIIKEKPAVVVIIADAVALERNLYLLAELLTLGVPTVLGLNMIDVAYDQGLEVEPHVLEAALGVPVIPMVASRNQGVKELMQAVSRIMSDPNTFKPSLPEVPEAEATALAELIQLVNDHIPEDYPRDWVGLRLLEGDEEIMDMVREELGSEKSSQVTQLLLEHENAILSLASTRYEWIERMVRAAVKHPRIGQISLTDRIDRVATHPLWGLLLMLGILGGVFWVTYAVGSPLQELLDRYFVRGGADLVRSALAGTPAWFVDLLADGVIGGAGAVITLIPILLIFFAALALLEDVGYMARAAYMTDRFMHPMGLHGKSALPLLVGFGCNVPAVLGTRIIESSRARLLTILLAPLVPCMARMAVISMMAPIFFGRNALLVTWGLLALNLMVLALLGLCLHKSLLGGQSSDFIMELPLYHKPNLRTIGLAIWNRLRSFLKNAGGIILLVSIVLWMLSTLPGGDLNSSYLASLGRLFEPVGKLMGLSWEMTVALLTSFVAKENTIVTLGILLRDGGVGDGLRVAINNAMTPLAALAFLATQMLFVPCIATVAVMKKEIGNWRWTLFGVLLLLVISVGSGIIIYQMGVLFFGGG